MEIYCDVIGARNVKVSPSTICTISLYYHLILPFLNDAMSSTHCTVMSITICIAISINPWSILPFKISFVSGFACLRFNVFCRGDTDQKLQ